MATGRTAVTSGIPHLDRILGELYIGDNVVWYDDAGNLAYAFCLNLLRTSWAQKKHLIYVSFDRSPKNLLDKLGEMAQTPLLTVLDCFTNGKGAGSDIFLQFYQEAVHQAKCRIHCIGSPEREASVSEALYTAHGQLEGDVRFVFESLTGMQEIWGGEEQVARFYSHACPRLYELNTVAYWLIEKKAHSRRLRAQINQIAQVAIELTVRRGKTFLSVNKAEGRRLGILNKPFPYWVRDLEVGFEEEKTAPDRFHLGSRIRHYRNRKGVSQAWLAQQVGVTPSTISQVETGQIYPSLPGLIKIAETLGVNPASFFGASGPDPKKFVFGADEATPVAFSDLPRNSIRGTFLNAAADRPGCEVYRLEIAPGKRLPSHFFPHKGEEIGYLLEGTLTVSVGGSVYSLQAGDLVVLTRHLPSQWRNPGGGVARLLWIKIHGLTRQ